MVDVVSRRAIRSGGVVAALAAACVTAALSVHPQTVHAVGAPDIVVIVTDDQRLDQLDQMPNVAARLQARGVTFARAFTPDSLCCPSRVSILRGQYSTTTGIWDIAGPYGGFDATRAAGLEQDTLATWLHDGGYRTALIGKYLNGYSRSNTSYVPPGWEEWDAFTNLPQSGGYYGYTLSTNGVERSWGAEPTDYSTDVLTRKATRFIAGTPTDRPLFLYLAYRAPHMPTTPGPGYLTDPRCGDESTVGEPSFNERDVSDKPGYVRSIPPLDAAEADDLGRVMPRRMCKTLQSVDDGVGRVLDALESRGTLQNTLVIYLSDNGYMLGEHRLRGKNLPYEESLRVPMILRFDPVTAGMAGRVDDALVANVDVAPTAVEAASVTPTVAFDGLSLLDVLSGGARRADVPIESLGGFSWVTGVSVPSYCGVRTAGGWAYIRYDSGTVLRPDELYDLSSDPFELTNLAGNPAYAAKVDALRTRARALCGAGPPGFSW